MAMGLPKDLRDKRWAPQANLLETKAQRNRRTVAMATNLGRTGEHFRKDFPPHCLRCLQPDSLIVHVQLRLGLIESRPIGQPTG